MRPSTVVLDGRPLTAGAWHQAISRPWADAPPLYPAARHALLMTTQGTDGGGFARARPALRLLEPKRASRTMMVRLVALLVRPNESVRMRTRLQEAELTAPNYSGVGQWRSSMTCY